MKRFNKEYNLTKYDAIQMKLGTINKDDPKVVYVSGRCWLIPKIELDYNEAFNEVKKSTCKKVKSILTWNDDFSNKFIFNFDINPESFTLNKKKYFAFDIFFRQSGDEIRKLKDLIPVFECDMASVCGEMVDNLERLGFVIEMSA